MSSRTGTQKMAAGVALAAVPISVAMHYERNFDWWIQEAFRRDQRWLVDEAARPGRILFYDGPKYLLVALAVFLLASALLRYRRQQSTFHDSLAALACLALVPALAGLGKHLTNEPCPREIFFFGGDLLPGNFSGRCFPGGHASGGFALFFLFWYGGQRARWILPGLAAGFLLGGYQILKGSHFFSDTLLTAGLAWLTCEGVWYLSRRFSEKLPVKAVTTDDKIRSH